MSNGLGMSQEELDRIFSRLDKELERLWKWEKVAKEFYKAEQVQFT